jgi:hypothetical protein
MNQELVKAFEIVVDAALRGQGIAVLGAVEVIKGYVSQQLESKDGEEKADS